MATNIPSASAPKDDATRFDEFVGPLYFELYAVDVANRIDPAGLSLVWN